MTTTTTPAPATPETGGTGGTDRRIAWLSWFTALLLLFGASFGAVTATVVNLPQLVGTARPAPAAPTPQLTIVSPSERHVPASGLVIRGTSSGLQPSDVLWVVTSKIGDNSYQPQTRPCQLAPTPDGEWTCPETFIGSTGDRDRSFYIIVYRVDGHAVDGFLAYDRTKPDGQYPGLREIPRGAEELKRVEVVRD